MVNKAVAAFNRAILLTVGLFCAHANRIQITGMRRLERQRPTSAPGRVHSLDVGSTRVTDVGATALGSVRELRLRFTRISDECTAALANVYALELDGARQRQHAVRTKHNDNGCRRVALGGIRTDRL